MHRTEQLDQQIRHINKIRGQKWAGESLLILKWVFQGLSAVCPESRWLINLYAGRCIICPSASWDRLLLFFVPCPAHFGVWASGCSNGVWWIECVLPGRWIIASVHLCWTPPAGLVSGVNLKNLHFWILWEIFKGICFLFKGNQHPIIYSNDKAKSVRY